MRSICPRFLLVCLFAIILAHPGKAALIVPSGLQPGDTYQLAFVTSGTTAATSTNIADYNSFVQSAAAAAGMGSVNWYAIASTPSVDANSNALVTTRVYNLNGELVATNYSDFWDNSHSSGIDYNESNVSRNSNVWTGTQADGTHGASGHAMGEATPYWAESTFAANGWINHGSNNSTVSYSLYALSETLVVPEPAIGLVLVGGAFVALARRRHTAVRSTHP